MVRRAARVDDNQSDIVRDLRKMGFSVELGHDDLLVGANGVTRWYEIKSESAVSRKTGQVLESKIKSSQKKIRSEFRGHYKIVASLDEILLDMGAAK